ncbi:hypothetical protein COMA2_20483 [Candidatus Nitrospira nitrificans]|uniref:Uncharacterized protein n=1 Tax=Candidatus Nitrospira nitrificans TaxID=1742973 RepID=A0A0S4LIN9_9BACT|nr:hypothetical protein COMA2_20483 [Candidatus Nitrospira nitrificans]
MPRLGADCSLTRLINERFCRRRGSGRACRAIQLSGADSALRELCGEWMTDLCEGSLRMEWIAPQFLLQLEQASVDEWRTKA